MLFLLTYFFYSLFFLTASSQTIGMMITDLRVVDADGRRPSISQLLRRGFGHLASVLVSGVRVSCGASLTAKANAFTTASQTPASSASTELINLTPIILFNLPAVGFGEAENKLHAGCRRAAWN